MRRFTIIVILSSLILCACGGAAAVGGTAASPFGSGGMDVPASEAAAGCTTTAWEVGMEVLNPEEARAEGRPCDSRFHFRVTKDMFESVLAETAAEAGYEFVNKGEESWNVRYKNPRDGYLQFDSTVIFQAAGENGTIWNETIYYDTCSGQIHSFSFQGTTKEECLRILSCFSELESNLCGDGEFLLDAAELSRRLDGPFARAERGWDHSDFVQMNGYAIWYKGDEESRQFSIQVSPSFDRDHGKLFTEQEAEAAKESCSGRSHLLSGLDHLAPELSGLISKMGYEAGEEASDSYNYQFVRSENNNGARAGAFDCYESRSIWNLERGGKTDFTYWWKADYDTATKKIHQISAALRSREDCCELTAAVLKSEAEMGENDYFWKAAGELRRTGSAEGMYTYENMESLYISGANSYVEIRIWNETEEGSCRVDILLR